MKEYPVKKFINLKNLTVITAEQIDVHLNLYNGYVNNTNKLNEILKEKIKQQDFEGPQFAELVRRLGFEYNGMRLHELYFAALNKDGGKKPNNGFKKLIEKNFNSFGNFKNYFNKIAAMRGVGWVILYQDKETKQLSLHWIEQHHNGHPAGFVPIIVMDIWEHAWSAYLKPTERSQYIEDYFANLDWQICQSRLV
ncbi:MAG: superoxide dismutase [Candidatus Buchananbacteria bacterium]|nr:superoxide dismutase [Candidatus Buchananbacteria bacterium]